MLQHRFVSSLMLGRIRLSSISTLVLIFAFASLVSLGASASTCCGQSELEEGAVGESGESDTDEGSQGQEGDIAGEGAFDDSEMFVPPSELPIKDVYERSYQTMTDAELAEELETISITPEGDTESLPVGVEDVEAFRQMLKTLSVESAELLEEGDLGESEIPSQPGAESVIGADTRIRINNTKAYPFRTVGRIDIGCTGTLIGKRHVLTAGHCVYNIRTNKWYSRLSFSPGQNGRSLPYGKIGWKRAVSVKGWTRDHKRDYDYAMIVLNKDIGNTVGWMGYGWKDPMPKYNININGYPGDKPFGTMWHAYCRLQIITNRRLYYACDTFGGMSGSGVYVYFPSSKKRTIYGIHAYGVDSTGYNGATRITKGVFNNLKKWKSTY